MAEEDKPLEDIEPGTGEGGEPDGSTDWKAMYEKALAQSRKWEKRSKANADKAKKWDEAAAGEESLEDRIANLEADKKALEDAKARSELVAKVAAKTGLAEAVVSTLNGADEKELESQSLAIAALKPKGAPSIGEAGKFPRSDGGKKSTAQMFADTMSDAGY